MGKRTKYKHRFDTIVLVNRWNIPFWDRSSNWIIFGFGKNYFSTTEYEYRIGFFGFDVRVWMIREPIS